MKWSILLLFSFSLSVNALPITWNSDGMGCEYTIGEGPRACLIGSFVFDAVLGSYSDLDLTFGFTPGGGVSIGYTPVNNMVEGDAFHLLTTTSDKDGYLSLDDYDLTTSVAQGFHWTVYHPLVQFPQFRGFLTPDHESPTVPNPATLLLLAMGLVALGFSRLKSWQHRENVLSMETAMKRGF